MVAGLAIGTMKLTSVISIIVLALGGAFFSAPTLLGWEPHLSEAARAKATPPAAQPAPPESSATALEKMAEPAPEENGHFILSRVLVTPFDQVVGNARVTAERVTWKPAEIPPATTQKWTVMADENGLFTFNDLPAGDFSITATTKLLGGAHDFKITEAGKAEGPRNIKMYPILRSYGVVQDSEGNPVAGVVLYPVSHELFPDEEFDHITVAGIRACSDAEGRFRFEGLIPGSWKLFVVAPGQAPFYTEYIPFYGLRTTVVIQHPGSLVARVVDISGKPMALVKGRAAVAVSVCGGDVEYRAKQYHGGLRQLQSPKTAGNNTAANSHRYSNERSGDVCGH